MNFFRTIGFTLLNTKERKDCYFKEFGAMVMKRRETSKCPEIRPGTKKEEGCWKGEKPPGL